MDQQKNSQPASTQLPQMLQLVTFGVGDCHLAVEIEHVQEINRQLELTPVPGAPNSIRGVINLRGDVVTVLNLHCLLTQLFCLRFYSLILYNTFLPVKVNPNGLAKP